MSEMSQVLKAEKWKDERLTPDDRIGIEPAYQALRKRFVTVLHAIPNPDDRAKTLLELQGTFANPQNLPWKKIKSQAEQLLETHGISHKDVGLLLKYIKPQWFMQEFSLGILLDDTVYGIFDSEGDPVAGALRLQKIAEIYGHTEVLNRQIRSTAFGELLLEKCTYPVAVVHDAAVNPLYWLGSKETVRRTLLHEMNWNMDDTTFIETVLKLKAYGFLESDSYTAPLLNTQIALHVQPHHPEFLQKIKRSIDKGARLDSDRLKKLKGLYSDFETRWYLQSQVENSGIARPLTHEQVRSASARTGVSALSMTRKSGDGYNPPGSRDREAASVMETEARQANTAVARLARSHRIYERNVVDASRLYGIPFRMSKQGANKVITTLIGLSAVKDLSGMKFVHRMCDEIENMGLIQFPPEVSRLESLVLLCMQALKYAHPTDRESVAYIKVLQERFLPMLDNVHDLVDLDRDKAIAELDAISYQRGKLQARSLVPLLKSDHDAVVFGNGPEVLQLRERLMNEILNLSKIFGAPLLRKTMYAVSHDMQKGNPSHYVQHSKTMLLKSLPVIGTALIGYAATYPGRLAPSLDYIQKLFPSEFNELIIPTFAIAAIAVIITSFSAVERQAFIVNLMSSFTAMKEKPIQGIKKYRVHAEREARRGFAVAMLLATVSGTAGYHHKEIINTVSSILDSAKDLGGELWDKLSGKDVQGSAYDESFALGNTPESPSVGQPTFYAHGASNYPGIFWVGGVCDYHVVSPQANGSIGCRTFANNRDFAEIWSLDGESNEQIEFHRTGFIESEEYTTEQEKKQKIEGLVAKGNIVRFNVRDNPFFEIPSGFYPVQLIVPKSDSRYIAAWQDRMGLRVFIPEVAIDQQSAFDTRIGVVYAPYDTTPYINQDSIVHPLNSNSVINYGDPYVLLQSGQLDAVSTNYMTLPMHGPPYETYAEVYSESGVKKLDSVPDDALLFWQSGTYWSNYSTLYAQPGFIDPALYVYAVNVDTGGVLPGAKGQIEAAGSIIGRIVKDGILVYNPGRDSLSLYVLPDKRDALNELASQLDSLGMPGNIGIGIGVGFNRQPYATRVNDPLKQRTAVGQGSVDVIADSSPSEIDITALPIRLQEALLIAKDTQGPRQKLDILYKGLQDSGFEYGFERFRNDPNKSPEEALVQLLRVDRHGRPVHKQQICNQFSFDLYMLLKYAGYPYVDMIEGFQQQGDTNFGGNRASAHQIVAYFDYDTGMYQLYETTLPDIDNDAKDYPRLPAEHSASVSNGNAAILVPVLAGSLSALLLLLTTMKKKDKIFERNETESQEDTLQYTRLYPKIEAIIKDLTPSQQLGFIYALASCCGLSDIPQVHEDVDTRPVKISGEFSESFKKDVGNDVTEVAEFISGLMTSGKPADESLPLSPRLQKLLKLLSSQKFRYAKRESPRVMRHFGRYFSDHIPENTADRAVHHMLSLSDQLQSLSGQNVKHEKDLKQVARALKQFYWLAL